MLPSRRPDRVHLFGVWAAEWDGSPVMAIARKTPRDKTLASITISIYWDPAGKWWDIHAIDVRGRVYKERAQSTADMDDMSKVLICKAIRAELEGWVF